MSNSAGDASSELPSRNCDNALVPSTGAASGGNNLKGHKNDTGLPETPPKKVPPSKRDNSPKNVMDVAGNSFQAGRKGPKGGKGDESESEINRPPSEDTSLTNQPVSAEDESMDTSSIIARVRARSAAKPKRYRQSAQPETVHPPKPKKKAPVASQKKETAKVAGEKASAPQKTIDPAKGAWTEEEQEQFENGIVVHGWGKWIEIQELIPTRSRSQVKSHAQKFLKHHEEKKEQLEEERSRMLAGKSPGKNTKGGMKRKSTSGANSQTQKKRNSPKGKIDPNLVASKPPVKKAASKRSSKELDSTSKASESKPASQQEAPTLAVPKPKAKKLPTKKAALKRNPPAEKMKPSAKKTDTESQLSPEKTNHTELAKTSEKPKASKVADPKKRALAITPKAAPPPKPSKRYRAMQNSEIPGTGSWTDLENLQFEKGCILHGWGNWKAIVSCVPTRTATQLKSHAQKLRKHRPAEVERLEKEHKLKRKQSLKNMGRTKSKKKKAPAKRIPLLRDRLARAPARKNTPESEDEWTPTEKKQFEDGCIFHGWGNWEDVSSHIHTKNVAEVSAHADTFPPEDVERLKKEHELNYPDDEDASEDEKPRGDESVNVNHVLLGKGGKKTGDVKPAPPPQASPQKTTVHDLDAAEAIMALNFSNWEKSEDESELEVKKKESSVGLSSTTETISESSQDDQDDHVSAATQESENDDMVGSEETDLKKVSKSISQADKTSAKPAEADDASVDSQYSGDKAMPSCEKVDFESGGGLNCQDSKGQTSISDGKEELSLKMDTKNEAPKPKVSNKPSDATKKVQPPPHWLAADTWDECLENIHRWNNELTKAEQNSEYLVYNRLSSREKERLRRKLVTLMNDRPTSLPL